VTKASVANVAQTLTLDQDTLIERGGRIAPQQLAAILAGIDVVLGR
jgi:hypothetical protein